MFDRAKIIAEGGTYHDEANPLIECAAFKATKILWSPVAESGLAPADIKEDANLPKRMMIEGVFQRAGVRNANDREYPFKLWERLLKPDGAVMTRIAEKAMIGHLEHPETGATDLNRGAIRIEKAWMLEDGTIMGRAMVFNTPEGQRIQEYITTGTKIGISSRGTGTVDAKGVVCEDFQLETWDMVYNPSTPGAHPGLTTEGEQSVHDDPTLSERKIETPAGDDTTRTQDVPMSLSKRIAEARASAQQFLAVDPKRLDEAGRNKLAADILDARVKLAQSFVGEERVNEVEKVLKSLDEAKAACENFDGGMVAGGTGDVQTGLPGGAFDTLNKTVAGLAGDVKAKAVESIKSLADLIAANMGKLPHIQAAVEAEISEAKPQVVEAAKHEELKALLSEARDEIITRTKREEAALALMAESAAKLKALQGKVAMVEAENAKAIATIAELTAAGGKKDEKTNESKDEKKSDDKKVDESTVAKPKSLHERIADKVKAGSGKTDAALPQPGQKTESTKDAGEAAAKGALHEEVTKSGKKSGADLLAIPMKRIAEDVGTRR